MLTYVLRRLLYSIVVLIGVTLLVFFTLRLTGDPVALLTAQGAPSQEQIAMLRHAMHLDLPLYQQYFAFISGAIRGDFGDSLYFRQSAFHEVISRMPATLELAGAGYLIGLILAIPTGIISAVQRGKPADFISRLLSLFGIAFPNFWLGLMFILIFGVYLHWLPVAGMGSGLVGNLKSLIMPAVTLGIAYVATLSRLLRSSLLEVLSADFVRTARAKGIRESGVLVRHALRNAMIPFVTVAGLQVAFLLGGTVVIEVVFAWPGVGQLVVNAINNRDYPLVQCAVTLLAVVLIVANLLVDLLYGVLDPRIQYQ